MKKRITITLLTIFSLSTIILAIDINNSASGILFIDKIKWYFGLPTQAFTIPEGTTIIEPYAFFDSNITKIDIPNTVTAIGEAAFKDCKKLTTVIIPNGVVSIGEKAFCGCTSVVKVVIPESVVSIGKNAFYGCNGTLEINCNIPHNSFEDNKFSKVLIKNSVGTIGDYAFSNCNKMNFIEISDSVISIGERAFNGCYNLKRTVIGKNVISYGQDSFKECTGELFINGNIPSSTNLGCGVFHGSKFMKVVIGNSVKTIGDRAFCGCVSLKYLILGDDITSIGYKSFSSCSMETVLIPDNVKNIGISAFDSCKFLKELTIGAKVSFIRNFAFCDCSALASIYCKAATPPAIYGNRECATFPFNDNMRIYVPTNSYDSYTSYYFYLDQSISQTNWSLYKPYITAHNF